VFALALCAHAGFAQDAPVISGGAAWLTTKSGDATFHQPVLAPVLALPIGNKLLIEARGDLREFISRRDFTSGPYEGQFFGTLEYLQLDYLVHPNLTITAGRYLTPFGIYNERLTAIWVRNLQEAPIIFPIGTRTTGSSDGVMLRGAKALNKNVQLNYTGYFSAASTAEQFGAGRAAGFRLGTFLPEQRFEIGFSYQRFLQSQHFDSYGAHVAWQPWSAPIDVKGEYAHAPGGHGYWVEAALREGTDPVSALRRFQPVARLQQFWRIKPNAGDLLPGVDTQQVDVGVNYLLPKEFRIVTSYGRRFAETGDRNNWNIGVTYRFVLPISLRGA
jgi:hypothetical protein